ncbi:hypothetical protein EV182_000718 [Spiromyces aspiralis]|uniref:Uncharacterized protein n=1 Tax=Spiromyces aspiralis TaxID=68401 RepID=A0ACC1HJ76_9FUNG|nr:hypothetical protein EV182_000718 [Spiromyces aspiralis]
MVMNKVKSLFKRKSVTSYDAVTDTAPGLTTISAWTPGWWSSAQFEQERHSISGRLDNVAQVSAPQAFSEITHIHRTSSIRSVDSDTTLVSWCDDGNNNSNHVSLTPFQIGRTRIIRCY